MNILTFIVFQSFSLLSRHWTGHQVSDHTSFHFKRMLGMGSHQFWLCLWQLCTGAPLATAAGKTRRKPKGTSFGWAACSFTIRFHVVLSGSCISQKNLTCIKLLAAIPGCLLANDHYHVCHNAEPTPLSGGCVGDSQAGGQAGGPGP